MNADEIQKIDGIHKISQDQQDQGKHFKERPVSKFHSVNLAASCSSWF
jgi:hypothetical protein